MSIANTTQHFAFLTALATDPRTADLDAAQIRCILYLAATNDGAAVVGDVVDGASLTPTSAGRRIDKLVAAGLITREHDTGNRRLVWLSLTARGKRVAAKVAELYRAPPAEVDAAE